MFNPISQPEGAYNQTHTDQRPQDMTDVRKRHGTELKTSLFNPPWRGKGQVLN